MSSKTSKVSRPKRGRPSGDDADQVLASPPKAGRKAKGEGKGKAKAKDESKNESKNEGTTPSSPLRALVHNKGLTTTGRKVANHVDKIMQRPWAVVMTRTPFTRDPSGRAPVHPREWCKPYITVVKIGPSLRPLVERICLQKPMAYRAAAWMPPKAGRSRAMGMGMMGMDLMNMGGDMNPMCAIRECADVAITGCENWDAVQACVALALANASNDFAATHIRDDEDEDEDESDESDEGHKTIFEHEDGVSVNGDVPHLAVWALSALLSPEEASALSLLPRHLFSRLFTRTGAPKVPGDTDFWFKQAHAAVAACENGTYCAFAKEYPLPASLDKEPAPPTTDEVFRAAAVFNAWEADRDAVYAVSPEIADLLPAITEGLAWEVCLFDWETSTEKYKSKGVTYRRVDGAEHLAPEYAGTGFHLSNHIVLGISCDAPLASINSVVRIPARARWINNLKMDDAAPSTGAGAGGGAGGGAGAGAGAGAAKKTKKAGKVADALLKALQTTRSEVAKILGHANTTDPLLRAARAAKLSLGTPLEKAIDSIGVSTLANECVDVLGGVLETFD